jgi:hypothetical protein
MFVREKQSHKRRYLVLVRAYRYNHQTKQMTIYLGKSFTDCDWDSIFSRVQKQWLRWPDVRIEKALGRTVGAFLRKHNRPMSDAQSLRDYLESRG